VKLVNRGGNVTPHTKATLAVTCAKWGTQEIGSSSTAAKDQFGYAHLNTWTMVYT